MRTKLKTHRNRIEALSYDIVALLERRVRVAQKVGEIKKGLGLPIINSAREQELLDRLISSTTLPPELVEDIFNIIFAHSRVIQVDQAS
jgi:chorismate mutase/prephenate dehydratase